MNTVCPYCRSEIGDDYLNEDSGWFYIASVQYVGESRLQSVFKVYCPYCGEPFLYRTVTENGNTIEASTDVL